MIKKILIGSVLLSALQASEEMPMEAKSGQCFTKTFYPPKFTKVLRTKSSKKVVLNDASVKYDVVPAQYRMENKKIKISDGLEKIIVTPTRYKTVYQKVLIEPSKQSWRRSRNTNASKAFSSCVQSASNSGMNIRNAKVGTCFYEHYQAEKYITTTSKLLASQASERIVVTPATYRTVSKQITVDSTSAKLIPSVAVYKKVQDKVVVAPARTEWKKTTCHDRGCNESEVVCLIEVPTSYKQITKKVVLQPAVAKKIAVEPLYKTINIKEMITPASSYSVPIPATYQTFEKREKIENEKYYWSDISSQHASTRLRSQCNKICLTETPAQYKKIMKRVVAIPAMSKKMKTAVKYTTIQVKNIIKPATFNKVVIPEEFITVITEKERTKGYAKWMPMVCESQMTRTIVEKIQTALKFQGFYHGNIDGRWNLEIKSAGRAYQKSKGLAVTEKLSIEAMKSLAIY